MHVQACKTPPPFFFLFFRLSNFLGRLDPPPPPLTKNPGSAPGRYKKWVKGQRISDLGWHSCATRSVNFFLLVKFYSPFYIVQITDLWDFLHEFFEEKFENFQTESLLASACFGTSLSNFLNFFVWVRITAEGSVPEIRIWSILLIKSDLNGVYIIVTVSFYISTTWWMSLLVYQSVPEGTCSQVLRSTSVDS